MFYALWQRPRKGALLLNFTFLFWYWIIVHLTSNAISCNQLKHKEFEDGGYWANEFTWYWVWLGGFERHADFNSTKIPVQNFGNSTCPMKWYISVAQTSPKPPCVWLLFLQAGCKRAVLGTTLLSNGKGHFGLTDQTTKRGPQDGPEYSGQTKPK